MLNEKEINNNNKLVESTREFKQENKKLLAGILALLLGPLGIHKFVLGYITEGIIIILGSIIIFFFTCGLGFHIPFIITLVEGIIYLTKSDEDFYETYQRNKRPWF